MAAMKKELLTFCDFYCGDCLGYTGVIADASGDFRAVLDRYDFGRTVEEVFPDRLDRYRTLREMLDFMSGLRCPGVCRSPDSTSECDVRACCMKRGLFACHECDEFESCDTLPSLHGGLHAETSLRNIRAIREMGLDEWLARGEQRCYWEED